MVPSKMPIDPDATIRILQDLVRIDSRNPGLEDGAPGEAEIARYLARRLDDLGWTPRLRDLGDGRQDVVARRAGRGDGPSLLIHVHVDTVGVEGMDDPFSGELRDGRVWGRGAQDVKGGAAAMLGLARALTGDGPQLAGDLVLAFVADEEDRSLGTEELVREVTTDAAIVLEPSDLDVCVAHRGFGIFRVETRGRVAHGGRPEVGVDANLHMVRLLAEIGRLGERWSESHRHEILGAASLHVPLLRGGRQLFIYAGECEAHVECRTVPGQTADGVLAEVRAAVAEVGRRVENFDALVELVQWREPWEVDPEAEIVRRVRRIVEEVRGRPPRCIGHPWWEDSAILGAAGIETVVIGPVGDGLHSEEEWVDAASVVDLAEILYRAAVEHCGTVED